MHVRKNTIHHVEEAKTKKILPKKLASSKSFGGQFTYKNFSLKDVTKFNKASFK